MLNNHDVLALAFDSTNLEEVSICNEIVARIRNIRDCTISSCWHEVDESVHGQEGPFSARFSLFAFHELPVLPVACIIFRQSPRQSMVVTLENGEESEIFACMFNSESNVFDLYREQANAATHDEMEVRRQLHKLPGPCGNQILL